MKILVVDDHALIREGLRQVLKGLDASVQVLDAVAASQAFTLADLHLDLDLVLLDFHLPDINGLQALSVISKRHPDLPVIMLSGGVDQEVVQQALQQGAVAFLSKSSLSEELLSAVRMVLSGGVYLSPTQIQALAGSSLADVSGHWQSLTLTLRQKQVLALLIDGHSNKAIGQKMLLSDETVKNHVSAIFRSLGVQNRTQAALQAKRLRYTSAGGAD
jgi:DNA-binding NarL/FixJ family response regulator